MPRQLRTTLVLLALASTLLVTGCRPREAATETHTAAIHERVVLEVARNLGNLTVTLDGAAITPVARTGGELVLDLAAAPSDAATAEAVVKSGRRTVLEATFELLPVAYASSEFLITFEGLSEDQIAERIADTAFSLVPGSYFLEQRTGAGLARLDIGPRTTLEAAQRAVFLPELLMPDRPDRVAVGPNYRYSVSRRPSWTSPSCDGIEAMAAYGAESEGWLPFTTRVSEEATSLARVVNAAGALAAGYQGSGVSVPVFDTGIGAFDVFDCPETPFPDRHGTHVAELVRTVAPSALTPSELACSQDGSCQSYEVVFRLLALEGAFLASGQKTVANLSLAGATGPDRFDDFVLYSTLKDLAERYADNFLVVAAAGNNGLEEDAFYAATPLFPAAYSSAAGALVDVEPIPNIISVGAAGVRAEDGAVVPAAFNPRGVGVDILAPGVRVCLDRSGVCDDEAGSVLTGTSFATAVVSGAAALAWQQCPELDAVGVKGLLVGKALEVEGAGVGLVNTDPTYACDGEKAEVEVRLEPASVVLPRYGEHAFTATVSGDLDGRVQWVVSDGLIIGEGRSVIFRPPQGSGLYTLTATSMADPSKRASAEVRVSTDYGAFSSMAILAGEVNDTALTPLNRTVRVAPGERLVGWVELAYESAWPPSATLAFGATPNWGDHEAGFLDYGTKPPIAGGFREAYEFVAPLVEGEYYIIFAFRAELTAAQTFSMTNWAYEEKEGEILWNDGNDIAGWSNNQNNDAYNLGRATGSVFDQFGVYNPNTVAATAIRIIVE